MEGLIVEAQHQALSLHLVTNILLLCSYLLIADTDPRGL